MKKTILVVDSQPNTRRFLRNVLQREGYDVIEAENEQTVWQAVRSHHSAVSLALIDVELPGLSGRFVADSLQTRAPLPVVFMSDNDREDLVANGRIEEGAALLHKPFTIDNVLKDVEAVLGKPEPIGIHVAA
jgi:DNA-binding response OmpR family regulator